MSVNWNDWLGLRAKWVTARNGAKVGSGAVSGVNMGGAIDAVEKASKVGLPAVVEKVKILRATIAKYKAGIAKKAPTLATWLDNNVEAKAKILEAEAGKSIIAMLEMNRVAEQCKAECLLYPDPNDFYQADKFATQNKLKWRDVAKPQFDRMTMVIGLYKKWTAAMKGFAGKKVLSMPGKTTPMSEAGMLANKLEKWNLILDTASKAADIQAYETAWGRAGIAPNNVDVNAYTNAIKAASAANGVK